MNTRQGFTLIELMIVIVIILILATLAMLTLTRSRMNANEASAISSTRTISTAETQFRTACIADSDSNGDGDYGTLQELATPGGSSPPFIDSELGKGVKQGYTFTVTVTPGSSGTPTFFDCVTQPITAGKTGVRQFYVDQGGVIRFTNDGSIAGPTSPPIN